MKAFTLAFFGLQADAARSSTQICVEIFDKGDGDRHAGRAMVRQAARPTRPSSFRSLRPYQLAL